jgi:putative transcriptional regulator
MTNHFSRFARRERISDAALREAVDRAGRGQVDADLGRGVIKQRVARPGQGRSGGFRVLLAYRAKTRSVFLLGFAECAREMFPTMSLRLRKTSRGCGLKRMARRSRWRFRKASFRRLAMAKRKKNVSPLAKALLETAGDMRKIGLMDRASHEKITLRHLGASGEPKAAPITGPQIRAMRERAKLSQAVFARYLNLTVRYVSQLERGAKQPTGAALALLNVIKRRGIEVIL